MRNATLLPALLLLGACAPADDPAPSPLGVADGAIVNGQVNEGDPAVVALTRQGQAWCTGTLIRPDVVLTAAHCLPPNLGFIGSYHQIDVFFGTSTNGPGTFIDAIDGWTHPGWNDNELYFDIGLLRLSQPVTVPPIPFRTDSMESTIGSPVRITGFGTTIDNGNDSGIKRVGNSIVSDVDPQGLFGMGLSPSAVCSGDSGGPAFIEVNGGEQVAGVHSRGDCSNVSIETSVPAYLTDIYAFIGEDPNASCDADGLCGAFCESPDPDCPCATDGHCTVACSDNNLDADCTAQCSADGECNDDCPAEVEDPDCAPLCGAADGLCDPLCAAIDPDCDEPEPACGSDDRCNPDCADDPDCSTNDADGDLEVKSGCAVNGAAPSGAPTAWWLLALMALGLRRSVAPRRRAQ